MAFYKIDNEELLVAPNCVVSGDYELLAQYHTTYNLPIDGWYWFDTEEQARDYFGMDHTGVNG